MMMRMLDAAGLEILTDHERRADEDNPKGYYEHERVKDLESEADKSWVREARGKVLKVISHLLKDLPDENFYNVIFMRRDLDEVIASQNKMLERRGEDNPIEDEKAKNYYLRHPRAGSILGQRSPEPGHARGAVSRGARAARRVRPQDRSVSRRRLRRESYGRRG